MLRAIIKRKYCHGGNIPETESIETIDFECQELENAIRGGGVDPERGSYDIRDLDGIEVVFEGEQNGRSRKATVSERPDLCPVACLKRVEAFLDDENYRQSCDIENGPDTIAGMRKMGRMVQELIRDILRVEGE